MHSVNGHSLKADIVSVPVKPKGFVRNIHVVEMESSMGTGLCTLLTGPSEDLRCHIFEVSDEPK